MSNDYSIVCVCMCGGVWLTVYPGKEEHVTANPLFLLAHANKDKEHDGLGSPALSSTQFDKVHIVLSCMRVCV